MVRSFRGSAPLCLRFIKRVGRTSFLVSKVAPLDSEIGVHGLADNRVVVHAQHLKGKCWWAVCRSRKSSFAAVDAEEEEAALSRIRKPQRHRVH
jgi:hypothetical protein